MKFVALALAAPILCGCGTKVPLLSTTVKEKVLVSDVHIGITCEITDAIHRIIQRANNTPHPERKRIDRFRGWGVKYALTLTVIEDSTVGFGLGTNSSANPNPGDSVLTVGSGLTRKTSATRTEADQVFDTVEHFQKKVPCDADTSGKISAFGNTLGIHEWLDTRIDLVEDQVISSLDEKEAFTYEVKFEISNRGNIGPKWEFTQRTFRGINGSFDAGRATTHSVLVTFGPVSKDRKQLAKEAETLHNARFLGLSVLQ